MKTYDVILTLGNGFTKDWGVPSTVENRLRNVAYLHKHKVSDKILISGGYSISWDVLGVKPPTTEAREMKKMLITFGIAEEKIFIEEKSKDTIGNLYFSKIKFLIPNNWKHILIVCTDVHRKRIESLANKILGNEYHVSYQTTPSHSLHDEEFIKSQAIVLRKQNEFLSQMKIGEDLFLAERLYKDPFYNERRPDLMSQVAMKGVT